MFPPLNSTVQTAAQHTLTQAERDLLATQNVMNSMQAQLAILVRRLGELQRMPGGRSALSIEQRVEYDLIGGSLADARAAIAKAEGSSNA